MGIVTRHLPHSWPELGHFMRRYGVRWLYVVYAVWMTTLYVQFLTADAAAYPDKEFTAFQTLQLTVLRTAGLLMFLPSLLMAAWYLWVRLPVDQLNPDQPFKTFPVESLSVKSPLQHRPHVPCMIVFIVTRGEYPKMIRRNVTYHLTLLERYLRCDRLEAHVVTERPLEGDYQVGSGRVREIVVPSNYKTPNGTLFRARNVVYWLENAPTGGDYPPENETWLLVLDEDVFVTEGFARLLAHDFLPSGADTCLALPLAYFDEKASIASIMSEAFTSVLNMAFSWLELDILNTQPVWFRGSGYVMRRDVDRKIGRDFGPLLCVSDDHVFGNRAAVSKVKFRSMYAWTYEGAAVSYWSLVCQRARWTRGNLLALLYQQLPLKRRLNMAARYILCNFIFLMGAVVAVSAAIQFFCALPLRGIYWGQLMLGARIWYLDYVVGFSVATWNWTTVYGFWNLLPSKRALIYTFGIFFYALSLFSYVQYIIGFCWMVISFTIDHLRGKQRLEVTPKKDE